MKRLWRRLILRLAGHWHEVSYDEGFEAGRRWQKVHGQESEYERKVRVNFT